MALRPFAHEKPCLPTQIWRNTQTHIEPLLKRQSASRLADIVKLSAVCGGAASCAYHRRSQALRRRARRGSDSDIEVNPVAIALRSQLAELARTGSGGRYASRWQDVAGARLLLPSSSIPWGVVHFVGGAILGQFPELCYSSLLCPFADRTGLAIICTPYELKSDHLSLAEEAGHDFQVALQAAAGQFGWPLDRMPCLAMGHSLGAKLQVLLNCDKSAGQQMTSLSRVGVALLAFNNFGVEDQIRLLRETLKAVQGTGGLAGAAGDKIWESFVEPAIGRAAKLTGLQFRPSPEELLDLVEESYGTSLRTRLFAFNSDLLDCSEELMEVLVLRGARQADSLKLVGGHLTPVMVTFDDVSRAAGGPGPGGPIADRLRERFGGMGNGVKLGNQEELDRLVEALVEFVGLCR